MIAWLKKIYFQVQIKFLVFFKSALLFDKINQLNWYQNTLRQWVDDQGFTVNSRVLEVGCASGALTAYIANTGCIPTGVDFSNGMIEFAKIKNKTKGEFHQCILPFFYLSNPPNVAIG